MTGFFIPGVVGDARSVEDAYGEMRSRIELELGSLPSARRIFRLWSRRGRVDCVTEVGGRDPLHGGIVIAIFDMGPRNPFVVCRQQQLVSREGVRETLGCHAYSVLEFDG
ncbi:MAG: hypothetical protein ACTHQQ_23600 [Solirubrobacteraceae bacterium]